MSIPAAHPRLTRPLVLLSVGLLAGALTGCGRRAVIPQRAATVPLTSAARYEGEPDLSPDGRTIVFSAWGAADRDLFTMSADGSGKPSLLYAGPGDDSAPHWSPDGARIAFISASDPSPDLCVVAAAGGEARRLTVETSREASPDWSPAGDRIVFVSDRGGRRDLWVMTLATGEAGPLTSTTPPGADYAVADPAWGEKAIVFSATVGGATDLYAIAPEGGAWRRLTDGPARERHPSLSTDGRIAFVSDTTGFFNLYVREADGRVTAVTEEMTDIFESTWSPDSRRILFTRRSPWAILAGSIEGGTVDTVLAPRGRQLHPTWSPDATELAFQSDLDGQDDVWRVQVGDRAAGPVTASRADDSEPAWSARANRIAFASDRSGNDDIWIMDPAGVEFLDLSASPARDREPRWSADGGSVLFVSDRAGSDDIWIVPASGGEPRRITDDPAPDLWPCPAGDGGEVWFESTRGGWHGLWRSAIDGGLAKPLTTPAGPGDWDGRPAVIPGSADQMVFVRSIGDNRGIYRLRLADGSVTPLFDDPREQEDHPEVSPDGRRIVWQSGGNFDIGRIDAPAPPAR